MSDTHTVSRAPNLSARKWRDRLRKIVLWGGLAGTILLAVVWIGSTRWGVQWGSPSCLGSYRFVVGLGKGDMVLSCQTEEYFQLFAGVSGAYSYRIDVYSPWFANFRVFDFRAAFHPSQSSILFPIWVPLALVLCATLWAWRLDLLARRSARWFRAGRCPGCGYDRKGLGAEALCPECAAARVVRSGAGR